jgi:hypothetical protein
MENSSLVLSPNPVSDRMQITIPETILVYTNTLQIWSSSGTLLLAKAISKESQLELDLGFLAEGLYSVVILDRQGNKLVQRRISKLTKWREFSFFDFLSLNFISSRLDYKLTHYKI